MPSTPSRDEGLKDHAQSAKESLFSDSFRCSYRFAKVRAKIPSRGALYFTSGAPIVEIGESAVLMRTGRPIETLSIEARKVVGVPVTDRKSHLLHRYATS